jgi:uncharacterized RDD family membrane protein YckC
VIDTLRPVSLPEGAEITLRLAGPLARSRAWLIDFGLRAVVAASLPPLFSWFGGVGTGLMMILWFALATLYPVVFEVLWNGATPGKRVCNLAVVNADGTPVGWPAAFLRNVMRFADVLPVGYAVGLASMVIDRQFRRLGDLAAGTVVIHRDFVGVISAAPAAGEALPLPVPLNPLEQRAVLDFAERRRSWSTERAAELAELAVPLVRGSRGEEAIARLTAIASGLLARR